MPLRRRRPLRALSNDDQGGAVVENALILGLTAVMLYTLKTTSGVAALIKPVQQAVATLARVLG